MEGLWSVFLNDRHFQFIYYGLFMVVNWLSSSAIVDHGLNLALMSVMLLLALILATRVLGSPLKAFVLCSIWLLSPINTVSIVWISERNDLLVGIAVLSALLYLIAGKGNVLSSPKQQLAVFLGVIAALFSKGTATFFPFAVAIVYGLKHQWKHALFYFALGGAYLMALLKWVSHLKSIGRVSFESDSYSMVVKLGNRVVHVLETVLGIILPLPFIPNQETLMTYALVLSLVGAVLYRTVRIDTLNDVMSDIFSHKNNKLHVKFVPRAAVFLCFLAFLVVSAASPQLRVHGLCYYLGLLMVFDMITIQDGWERLITPVIVALVAVNVVCSLATMRVYDTRSNLTDSYTDIHNDRLFPNNYYEWRKQYFKRLATFASGGSDAVSAQRSSSSGFIPLFFQRKDDNGTYGP